MRASVVCAAVFLIVASAQMFGQLIDRNKAPNTVGEGISRPLIGFPLRIFLASG